MHQVTLLDLNSLSSLGSQHLPRIKQLLGLPQQSWPQQAFSDADKKAVDDDLRERLQAAKLSKGFQHLVATVPNVLAMLQASWDGLSPRPLT